MKFFSSGAVLKEGQISVFDTIKKFLVYPLRSGVFGFLMFFTILLATKFISSIIGTVNEFGVELDDVWISSIGFVLVFLIRFLENFKD